MERPGLVLAVAATLAVTGCVHSASPNDKPASVTVELGRDPNTKFTVKYRSELILLDASAVAQSVIAISADGSVFVFNHAPDAIRKARSGATVLIAGLALRKVASVHTNGDYTLVETDPATLTDAIREGTVAWDHTISFGQRISTANGSSKPTTGLASRIGIEIPVFADGSNPVTVRHTGSSGGWQYTTITTVGDNKLDIDETLTRQDAGGMQITLHAKGTLNNFNTSADIEIQDGQVVKFTYLNKNVSGSIDFEWQAKKTAPGVGNLPQKDRLVALPPLVSIPLDIEGLPFTLDVESAMLAEPAFTAADEASIAHFTVSFSGDQGFTVQKGETTRAGTLHGNVEIGDDTNAVSPIAASSFVGALSLPKLELKPGIVPDALVPSNGAFADRAKQMLALSGYLPRLSQQSGLPADGSYVQLIASGGLMHFGSADAFIPCQQATLELSLKVGNASSLGVPSLKPNETYELKTWHRINPAVQYCARGLTDSAPATQAVTSTAATCDSNATGEATDYDGVRGGSTMQAFLAGKKHPGIDVTHLRDDPVFANVREDVPVEELNHAMMLATKLDTGVGLRASGTAHLVDAQVIIQPWWPGCPSNRKCDEPQMSEFGHGGIVGLAVHYSYGDNQMFTVYVEYEHLITKTYPPRKDDGTYIDNQGQPIGQGDYVDKQLGCIDFGSAMKPFAVLSADKLRDHPLIGYLGATQNPHVHIQAAFALNRQGYLGSNFFDPDVVLVR